MKEYMDEQLIMSQLEHPNIVSFLGASMTPPNLFFVMELCQVGEWVGGEWVERMPPVPAPATLRWLHPT